MPLYCSIWDWTQNFLYTKWMCCRQPYLCNLKYKHKSYCEDSINLSKLFLRMLHDADNLLFYVPFNIIQAILRQQRDDNERLCAMKPHTVKSRILHPAGFEPRTSLSTCIFRSANHAATRSFIRVLYSSRLKSINVVLISPWKHILWVLIRNASVAFLMSTHNVCFHW